MTDLMLYASTQGLQNVYTPLSMKAHFYFCIFATALYLTQFYRKGSWHYMLIMAAIDLSFMTQLPSCQNNSALIVLAVLEFALLGSAAVLYYRYSKSVKEKQRAAQEAADEENKKKKKAEKLQKEIDSNPVDNAFDDSED